MVLTHGAGRTFGLELCHLSESVSFPVSLFFFFVILLLVFLFNFLKNGTLSLDCYLKVVVPVHY